MTAPQAMVNDKKEIFGWAMYDWANSAFSTTVVTALLRRALSFRRVDNGLLGHGREGQGKGRNAYGNSREITHDKTPVIGLIRKSLPLLRLLPGCVRIEECHLRSDFDGVLAKILLVDDAVMVADE